MESFLNEGRNKGNKNDISEKSKSIVTIHRDKITMVNCGLCCLDNVHEHNNNEIPSSELFDMMTLPNVGSSFEELDKSENGIITKTLYSSENISIKYGNYLLNKLL